MWQYWGFRAALWLAARVPRPLGYRAAALGGELYFWLNPAHSHKAVENYAVLLADDVRSARARLTARATTAWCPLWNPSKLPSATMPPRSRSGTAEPPSSRSMARAYREDCSCPEARTRRTKLKAGRPSSAP